MIDRMSKAKFVSGCFTEVKTRKLPWYAKLVIYTRVTFVKHFPVSFEQRSQGLDRLWCLYAQKGLHSAQRYGDDMQK